MQFMFLVMVVLLSVGTLSYVFSEEYINDQYSFNLQYPDNWTIEKKPSTSGEKGAIAGERGTLAIIFANIIDDGYPDLGADLGNFGKYYLPSLRIAVYLNQDDLNSIAKSEYEKAENSEYVNYDSIDLKETSGEIFNNSYLLTTHYNTRTSEETFTTDGKNVFSFLYMATDDLFDVYKDDFQKVIKSIKFLQ